MVGAFILLDIKMTRRVGVRSFQFIISPADLPQL
nr:MAG TPA: hypothetical protein [Caudoviricetes sp.]DAT22956.1 MAG TPA: hypothetical protein [Caudoviricetes sp.]